MAAFVLASVCGSVWAQQTAAAHSGLGQAWPNVPDVSSSPRWHVYVFERDGIRFIQVNDLNGTVRGAFAAANDQFLVLPIGADSQNVSTPQQPRTATATASAPSETVYQDNSVQIQLTPQFNGHVLLKAASATCQDRDDCGVHVE
ncbi:hypothetical protein DVJ77_02595 [Dyella tabacisoli]|uniref:Uncharacterized protein n=2 Tax=Dyella tabacisoli TaxID=2282381 RepID=A0A369US35_9GAMM|nr:hypothetical protein DVJ77_02595 [Dyella tabacisoli]